ncbi:MAG: hypothetical protein WC321_06295 [Candidatus Omnitrophota bacterium]|jgi:type II secretory pathway pseudopilin PulG
MRKRGQTIVELAIFGSLILFLFGVLLSYMQRQNDQQYVQMETFRRALDKACTFQGEVSEGAGGSVQYTFLENRPHVDLTSGFGKGSPSNTGNSANVFWAIPKTGSEAESLIVYRVNQDEKTWNYRDLIPEDSKDTFRIEDTKTVSEVKFDESSTKRETPQEIANIRQSKLQDTLTTTINYTIREEDDDDDPDNDPIAEEDTLWTVTQGLYRDADGQYKYSSSAVGTEIARERTWATGFTP